MSAAATHRAVADAAGASDAATSPCISVCVMDVASGLCIGCRRTLDEIAAWSVLDPAAKRRVLAALPGRRAVKRAFEP
jgi:predicted Fe-S protein YdhL (DUF1289 family)